MKKLVVILAILGIIAAFAVSLTPLTVGAQCPTEWESCCEYPADSCCRDMCCAEITQWYRVSYFERVEVGTFQGKPCYAGVWTTVEVEAHDRDEAAEMLGLRRGFDCLVSHI